MKIQEKEEHLINLPKFKRVLLLAFSLPAILMVLSIFSKRLGDTPELFVMLGISWCILFVLLRGWGFRKIKEEVLHLFQAEDKVAAHLEQIANNARIMRRISSYVYAIIITVIFQYGWFYLEFEGVGNYIMYGFVYLLLSFEMFLSFQAKRQVDYIQKLIDTGLDELLEEAKQKEEKQ